MHITARITFIHVFIRSSNMWLSYILNSLFINSSQNFWTKLPTDSTWNDFNSESVLRGTDADHAKSSLWNCQSFKSGFGDDRFPLLHHFGDKFSVGAVNFHSIGRLIDNSEHLFGLIEGKRSVANFTGDLHQQNLDIDEKAEFLIFSCAQGTYHSYALHEISRYTTEFINVAVLRFTFIFWARSTFEFYEKNRRQN